MPRRPAIGVFSVPISKPRYTAVESQLMISPWCRSATASASALLPVAVGPRIARTRGLRMIRHGPGVDGPFHRHRHIGNEPVPLHLRDEPPDPGAELDAFGVELNLRAELSVALLVLELIALDVALQVSERLPERAARRRGAAIRAVLRRGRLGRRQLRLGFLWRRIVLRLRSGGGVGRGPLPPRYLLRQLLDAFRSVAA